VREKRIVNPDGVADMLLELPNGKHSIGISELTKYFSWVIKLHGLFEKLRKTQNQQCIFIS